MIYGLILVIHVILALLLIIVILLQGGRGGLGETLGGGAAQSLFGGGANTVMTKITAIGAGMFMVSCLTLAMLSTHRGRSVVDQLPADVNQLPLALPSPKGTPPVAKTAEPVQAPTPAQPTTPHESPSTTPPHSSP